MKILLWPFQALWSFIGFLFSLTGRLVSFAVALALTLAGTLLTATVVGAFVGVPMLLFGFALLLRSLF